MLGGIATWLVRPDEHPLASRLLRFTRVLLALDVAIVLIGAANLVVHKSDKALWTVLAWLASGIAALVALPCAWSWLTIGVKTVRRRLEARRVPWGQR